MLQPDEEWIFSSAQGFVPGTCVLEMNAITESICAYKRLLTISIRKRRFLSIFTNFPSSFLLSLRLYGHSATVCKAANVTSLISMALQSHGVAEVPAVMEIVIRSITSPSP